MAPKINKRKKSVLFKELENKEEIFEGKRYFKDPKIISEHLICGICQDIFDEPWRLTCGHSFCLKCITPWIKSNNTCPIDRMPVNSQFSHKDILVANIIGDYMIACPWRPFGCTLIDKYYLVKDHRNKCEHNPNNIKDKIVQAEAMKIYNASCLSPMQPPTATVTRPKYSALDELMNDLGDGPLDASIVESEDNCLPEPETMPLSMRMYLNGDDMSKKYVCSMLAPNTSAEVEVLVKNPTKRTKK